MCIRDRLFFEWETAGGTGPEGRRGCGVQGYVLAVPERRCLYFGRVAVYKEK